MNAFLDGVRAQPDNLARSAAVVGSALAGPVGSAFQEAMAGGVLAFGMGASTHAAAGFAAALRSAGRAAVALSAADLADGVPPGLAAAFLAISESGLSTETVAAMAAVLPGEAARLALTNHPDRPLAGHADAVLPLGCAPDTRVSTLSYTATVQALGLLVDHLTGRTQADWPALPGLVATLIEAGADDLASALAGAGADVTGCVDVVGSGVRVASAGAAALLLREAANLPAAAFSTREYLHGPLETVGPGRAVLLFGAGRELPLAAELAGYGAAVVLITEASADAVADLPVRPNLHALRLPPAEGLARCVLDIVPVQLAAEALARRVGRPIELRHMPADTKLPGG